MEDKLYSNYKELSTQIHALDARLIVLEQSFSHGFSDIMQKLDSLTTSINDFNSRLQVLEKDLGNRQKFKGFFTKKGMKIVFFSGFALLILMFYIEHVRSLPPPDNPSFIQKMMSAIYRVNIK